MRLFSVKKKMDENLKIEKRRVGLGRKVLVVTGCIMALFLCAPVVKSPTLDNIIGVEQTYASELPYSHRWVIQSNGDWMYKMEDGSFAKGKWLKDEVDLNWYLMNDNGIMRSGIFKSYDRYYLLSEVHDGHFGHLVKNGEVYKGITIQADTSSDYEGALSAQTINALKAIGYNFDTVLDVSGTSHVSAGKITHEAPKTTQTQDNSGLSAFEKAMQGQVWQTGAVDGHSLVDEGGGTSGDEGMPVWNSQTNRS